MSSKNKIAKFVCRKHGLGGLRILVMPEDSMHQFKTICRPCGDRHTGWCNEQQARRLVTEYESYLDGLRHNGKPSGASTTQEGAPPLVPTVEPVSLPSNCGLFIEDTSSASKDAKE